MSTENAFTGYNHELLTGDNSRVISNALAIVLKAQDIQLKPEHFVDDKAVLTIVNSQLREINSINMWAYAYRNLGINPDLESLSELSDYNEEAIGDLATVTTSGIISGAPFIGYLLQKRPSTPMRELALAAVSDFDTPYDSMEEFANRVHAVFGSSSDRGKLQQLLSESDEELLKGQPLIADMLAVFGERTYDTIVSFTS